MRIRVLTSVSFRVSADLICWNTHVFWIRETREFVLRKEGCDISDSFVFCPNVLVFPL